MISDLRAPFPFFGGKRPVAEVVWQALGNVDHYIEPFAGSLAVLLARPDSHRWWEKLETVSDRDGLLINVWRAIKHDPEAVVHYADWPLFECDLHARHARLVEQAKDLHWRLEGDPDYYDPKLAGWWVWGRSACIANWCTGRGPWQRVDGKLVKVEGRGGIARSRPQITSRNGIFVLGDEPVPGPDQVEATDRRRLLEWLGRLSNRLRRVRIICGDWTRAVTPALLRLRPTTAVFLDPPYTPTERDPDIYAVDDLEDPVAVRVREWCLAHEADPGLRIALCGYAGEHDMPASWRTYAWIAQGGLGNQGEGRGRANRTRECIWFSPGCLPLEKAEQLQLGL